MIIARFLFAALVALVACTPAYNPNVVYPDGSHQPTPTPSPNFLQANMKKLGSYDGCIVYELWDYEEGANYFMRCPNATTQGSENRTIFSGKVLLHSIHHTSVQSR